MFLIFLLAELFNTANAWFGVSAKHLNRPNISFTSGGNVPLNTFYAVSAGYTFVESSFLPLETQLLVTGNYMKQGRFSRLDLGGTFYIRKFFFGATFVTNPTNANTQILSSVNLFTGMQYDNLRAGLSYDLSTSQIGRTGGVYEVSLTYQFDTESERCFGCPTSK